MIDSYGRTIHDLRISITDRCNFRCVYCMDPDVRFMDRAGLLTTAEIGRLAGIVAGPEGLGVTKIRLTGGEPTLHPELTNIVRAVAAAAPGVEIAMTTNGATLTDAALAAWRAAGLSRLTLSMDAVEPESFARLTRSRSSPDRVLAGLEAALRAGLDPVKVNAVVLRGLNDDQVVPLAGVARRYGIEFRFIEFMPLDSGRRWTIEDVVPADEVLERIGEVYPLVPIGRGGGGDASSTSECFTFADGAPGRIGVIAPVTRPFCGACSRLRITADGKVRPCLFSTTEWDLMPLLRTGEDDEAIREFLVDATWTKQRGHGIATPEFRRPRRPMSAIGG
jgi:cyclic pyranopterin phosphate synthase